MNVLFKILKLLSALLFVYVMGSLLAVFVIEPVSPWQLKNASDFTDVSTPDAILGFLSAGVLVGLTVLGVHSLKRYAASRKRI